MKFDTAQDFLWIAESLAAQLENRRALLLLSRLGADCPVVYSEEAETARIVRVGARRLRIELAPSFVRAELRTPRDVLFVLLHEVLHRVHGDLDRGEVAKEDPEAHLLANVVADVRINRFLCSEILPEGVALLDRLYGKPTLPGALLLPPHRMLARFANGGGCPDALGIVTLAAAAELPRNVLVRVAASVFRGAGIDAKRANRLARWYRAAWLEGRCSHARLLGQLREILKGVPLVPPTFLGDHAERPGKRVRLGRPRGRRAGHGSAIEEARVTPDELADPDQELRRRVRAALEPVRAARALEPWDAARVVVPGLPGRRALLFLAAGVWPSFFESRVAPPEDAERVHVYVDVSESTGFAWASVYGLVRHLGALVAEPVFLFSDEVVPVPLDDVWQGRVVTSGGTDFDAVARHVLAQRFQRVLVVTDGWGLLDACLARALSLAGVSVFVVLTERDVESPGGIVDVAREVWTLPAARSSRRRLLHSRESAVR